MVCNESGLHIIDISNPLVPTFIDGYDIIGRYAEGLAISGDYAYITDNHCGLHIINIADLSPPILTIQYEPNTSIYCIEILGNYAFAAGGSKLYAVNISDPKSPVFEGYHNPPTVENIAVFDKYAYVACGFFGYQIFDISDPLTLSLVKEYDTLDYTRDVTISGEYVYVASGDSGLFIWDRSNPLAQTVVGSYNTPGRAYGVKISGNFAYIADGDSGLIIIDISDPSSPRLIGSTPPDLGYTYDVTISGNYAYTANGILGIKSIDISDPSSPTLLDSYNTPGWARFIAIQGNYAYVSDDFSRIPVFDISNPTNIKLVGAYQTRGNSQELAIDKGYIYSADCWAGLSIIDTNNLKLIGIENKNNVSLKCTLTHNYPNPFNPSTTINFPNLNSNADITIYSIDGRKVISYTGFKGTQLKWNATGQPSGIYIVKVNTGDRVFRKRLVLVK